MFFLYITHPVHEFLHICNPFDNSLPYVYLQIKLPITVAAYCGYLQDLVPLSPATFSVQAFPIFPSISSTTLLNKFSLEPQTTSSPSSKTQPFIPLQPPTSPPSRSEHRLALATQCPFFCSVLQVRSISPLPPTATTSPPATLPQYETFTKSASVSNVVSKNSARNTENLPKNLSRQDSEGKKIRPTQESLV